MCVLSFVDTHIRGLVIAFCIACEWIGLLLLRQSAVFKDHLKDMGREGFPHGLATWKSRILRASEIESNQVLSPHSMFSKARIAYPLRPQDAPYPHGARPVRQLAVLRAERHEMRDLESSKVVHSSYWDLRSCERPQPCSPTAVAPPQIFNFRTSSSSSPAHKHHHASVDTRHHASAVRPNTFILYRRPWLKSFPPRNSPTMKLSVIA